MKSAVTTLGTLTRNAAQPFYQQIKDTIRGKIDSGRWQPGERTPSENQLVRDLGVSRMTVNRALRELTQEGRLKRVHGVGTFVAERRHHASLVELQDIAEEIQSQGRAHRAEVHMLAHEPAVTDVATLMELESDSRVYHVTLLHLQDEVPIQLEDRYVNPALAPAFLSVDFLRTTPTQHLMGLFQPDEVEHVVQAVMPSAQTRGQLRMPPDEPCLSLRRRTWKHGKVVTLVSLYYPGARYDLAARYLTDRYPQPHN